MVHHRITKQGMISAIDAILNPGGQMAPTTDKLRRGLPMRGESPDRDMVTGGANYFFTRVKTRETASGIEGIMRKSRLVSRLDAISYDRDRFEETTGNTVMEHRVSTIEGWRRMAHIDGAEENFKNGLSIFDDMDTIITSRADHKKVIDIFLKHGYTIGPDGRPLTEVIKPLGSV